MRWASNSVGNRRVRIPKNATTVVAETAVSATAVTTVPMNLAMFVQLGVGDYLVAEALQSSGAALNLDASSTFWLKLG